MNWTENIFQEFIDALQTAMDEDEFERIATRASHGLGFRWFAYLSIVVAAGSIGYLAVTRKRKPQQ